MSEQDDNLERVSARLSDGVKDFCRGKVGETFHIEALRQFVRAACGPIAPDSPHRVMRDLRQRGIVQYEVVSRANSEYKVISVQDSLRAVTA